MTASARARRAADRPGLAPVDSDELWIVRPAAARDLEALIELAARTGGGFTALPLEPARLEHRLASSLAAFGSAAALALYMLVLENAATGRIGGTASIIGSIGAASPLHSLRMRRSSRSTRDGWTSQQTSLAIARDLEGCSEVGGLFLRPELRKGGLGRLLARSRYLFIAQHRARFADRIASQLRGYLSADGQSPFWDGVGRRFWLFDFPQAERVRSEHGTSALVELFPDHPLCLDLADPGARRAAGRPHPDGEPAMQLLLAEGFADVGDIDLLEGGPNLVARTDELRAVRELTTSPISMGAAGPARRIACVGAGAAFRCWYAALSDDRLALCLGERAAARLQLEPDDLVAHVPL